MVRYYRNGDTPKDTKVVYALQAEVENQDTSKSSAGPTDRRGVMGLVGSMMYVIENWLVEARSYEITGVGVLLFSLLIGGVVGMFLGLKYDRSKLDIVAFGKQKFQMVGMAKVADNNGQSIFAPVYKELPK